MRSFRIALLATLAAAALTAFSIAATAVAEDAWIDLPSLPEPRQEVGVTALDGKIYVIGGILADRSPTGAVSRFDPVDASWDEQPSLPDDLTLHHVGAAATAGRVFAVGGLDGSFRGSARVFMLEPDRNPEDPGDVEWVEIASLHRARGAMGVASLAGKIYAAGGQSGSTTYRDFEVYDPSRDEWTVLAPMPTARNHLAAVSLSGSFWALSGRAGGLRSDLESYDPRHGEWTEHAAIPTPRGGLAAAVLASKIFAFGGEGNVSDPRGIFREVEAFDPATGLWEKRPDMARPRHGIGAAALDGKIYIPGGAPVQGFATTDAHDAFMPRELADTVSFLRADANLDGLVDISDPVFILVALFRGEADLCCEDAADANDDGDIDISDAAFALSFLFLGGPEPPAPGISDLGPDPTPDGIGCEGGAKDAG